MNPFSILKKLVAHWVAIFCIFIFINCGKPDCPQEMSGDGNAPRITNFEYIGPLGNDPFHMILGLEFSDKDVDLYNGKIFFYIDGRIINISGSSGNQDGSTSLSDYFDREGLAATVGQGELGIPLRFSAINQDTKIYLGAQIQDQSGKNSNCYMLQLKLDVKSIASAAVSCKSDKTRI